jgi:hypothetical protein
MLRSALVFIVLGRTTFALADRAPEPPPPAPLPAALDRAAIAEGMASIKTKVMSCGDSHKATGTVKLEVVVGPDGRVTKATTNRPDGDPLGACVAATVRLVAFKKTQNGGSFSYPWVFAAPTTPAPVKPADPTAPADALDRAAISAGIAAVKSNVASCGDTYTKASGKVRARIVVGADGRVTNVIIEETPEAALGACVAGALQKATFKKTASGGSFSYPFVFGSAPPPVTSSDAAASAVLDRAAISDGIAKVKGKISACGTGANAKVKGTVKIKVTVAPTGVVTTAEVASTPAAPLGACVAGVLKGATFAKTAQGGSFSYPFVF